MRIITTHLGADFDALGATVAARLLLPDARIAFPGSQEAAVRRFLEQERIALPEIRVRELRRARIDEALVVDCASWRRLGEVGELIRAAACPVRVYDHHPEGPEQIEATETAAEPVAATCTVLVHELQRRGIEPDALTAALMVLGIYEDTGGLTYADTTVADVEAVAWLLPRGGRLDWVRRYVLRPLEPEQLALLNQLVEGAVEHRVGQTRVVVSIARPSEHLDEAAYVIHRYAEIFDLPVVIAILESAPQLVVIVRSTEPAIDAGQLLRLIGGGGHATAAAARVRGTSAVELAERLIGEVRRALAGRVTAGAVATPYLHTCPATFTVSEAKDRLVRLRVNAVPVAEGGALLGVVTRQVLDNALASGLADRPVTTVMRPGVPEVAADASLDEVERVFMEHHARFVVVPIPQGWGVLTRMDLFRRRYERQLGYGARLDRRLAGARATVHDVGSRLLRALPLELRALLQTTGEEAAAAGMRAFLVGGAVRDVLLGRAPDDIDVVVEGSAPELARRLAARLAAACHVHEPFLTARLRFPNGAVIDLASARTEFYRTPAALPEVETSAMRQDLFRRDFTINAMAIALKPGHFGELVDFFGGQRDLQAKQIRVLHSLSFLDDPTRAIRAVRFATRLGFEIAGETRQLIRVAVGEGVFARVTGERLRDELAQLFADAQPVDALAELARLGVLGEVAPGVTWSAALHRFLHDAEAVVGWGELEEVATGPRWPLLVAALASRAGEGCGRAIAAKLSLAGRNAALVVGARAGVEGVLAVVARPGVRPSEVVADVERRDPRVVLLAMAAGSEEQRRMLRQALTVWIRVPKPLTGAQLRAAGVGEGKALGRAVRLARAAVLDGEISAGDALAYALRVVGGAE